MITPIYDFLKEYNNAEITRFHMPGHKGNHFIDDIKSLMKYDITEIMGADSLFEAESIIVQSENETAKLYDTKFSCFSAGGSTLLIQTMLALICSPNDSIICARNAHKAFINTCTLLDLKPIWVLPRYNDNFGVSGEIDANDIRNAIIENPSAKAVYVTSPDYLGCISDIKAISKVCKEYNKYLLVDNAHGAHLKFTEKDMHPITLGADICCDSAHKTLPVLTGGAYLHISKDIIVLKDTISKEEVKSKMALFGSTSPSYLILLSLDLNNLYLQNNAKNDFIKLQEQVEKIYEVANTKGLFKISRHTDITKVTFDCYEIGYTGDELADILRENKIEPEYVSSRHIVLMLSPFNSEQDIKKLISVIRNIKVKPKIESGESFTLPDIALSPREATFANKETVLVSNSLGRISAQTKIKCPPGVPFIIAGEIINQNTQKLLKKSSINLINVVK